MADYTSETLRELLVAALKASGRKQVWIAEQLNVSQKHLSQLLTGRVELTLGWAQRIAVLCDHRIDLRVVSLPGAADLQRRLAELQPEIDRLAALGAVTAVAPPGCQGLAPATDGAQLKDTRLCPAKHGALGRICELSAGHDGMHTGSGPNGGAVWDGDAP